MRVIICLYRLAYLVKLYTFCARVPTYSAKYATGILYVKIEKMVFLTS